MLLRGFRLCRVCAVHFLLRCCVGSVRCCYGSVWREFWFGCLVVGGFGVVWVLVVGLRCWLLLGAGFGGCVQLCGFGVLRFVVFVVWCCEVCGLFRDFGFVV